MSQFQRSAPKTGIATFVPLPATPGTVVVPVSDPLSLLRMVVIDLNTDPGASNQTVTLKTGGVLVGAEFFLMLRSSVAVAGAPFVIVQDESLGVIYGFSLAGVTADSYRWVKVRWNGGSSWQVVSYYVSGTLSPLAATTTDAGVVALATAAETVAGTEDDKAMTPAAWKAVDCVLVSGAQTNATTTLAAITSLTTPSLVAGTYVFELVLDMTTSSTGGYKLDFGGGTAVISSFLTNVRSHNVAAGTGAGVEFERLTSTTGLSQVGTSVSPAFFMINGAFVVGTAGTFAPRVALVSAAGTLSVTALSTLKLRRVS